MTSEWQASKRLFDQAIKVDPQRRADFLQKHSPGEGVRREVESLVAAYEKTERVLGFPTSIGDQLLSQYRILGQIGGGGMGLVYKARDEQLDRIVAVKVLPPWATSDPVSRARLAEEARCAGALNHPNIVTIYEMAREKDIDFIVMEYVDGKTLDRHIPARGLPLMKAITWALQIGSALEAVHAIAILHRDLKPSNVIVTRAGIAKLLDFGLAVRPGGHAEISAFGTEAYMAPEQIAGQALPDQRSDIFSFGIMLYLMMTGKMPVLEGPAKPGTTTRAWATPSLPPKVHTVVAQTIQRCLAEHPQERFQSISDVLDALNDASRLGAQGNVPSILNNTAPNSDQISEVRALVRSFRGKNPAESRRAFTQINMILKGDTSREVRQVVVAAMKTLILSLAASPVPIPMHVRENRKRAIELLRTATQDNFECFDRDDLEHLDLFEMNFSLLSLSNISFQGSFLVQTDFQHTALQKASFAGASIRNVNFTAADLLDCDFTEADWFHATGLTEAQLSRARKNTLRPCPSSIREMHSHLASRYGLPFSSWSDQVQTQIKAAWDIYLQTGGLRDVVGRWRGVL